ncbi:MAG: heavy metal-binding domain-containing protein, partial [bacterium]|nr:heavy metal-binding domain-containing protein [bacterium]
MCPMHPEIRQERAGICSVCGMNLILGQKAKGKRQKHGYDKHAGHSTAAFARKFWVSLVLTVLVVLYSELPERLLSWSAPAFPGSLYLPFLFGTAVFFYGGWVFLAGAWRELRGRLPGMMTLIGLAISVAYLYSLYVTVTGGEGALYWELTTLITVMLLGHWMEMKAVSGAQGALRELSKLLPDTAEVI